MRLLEAFELICADLSGSTDPYSSLFHMTAISK